MKKVFKILIPVFFIAIISYFGFQIFTKIQHKKEVAENIKTLPTFEYQNINGGFFTNVNLKANTSKLFIYYNSECDFCNEEAKMIKANKDKFDTTQIIFISFEAIEKIKQFAITHQLDSYDNITFLCDSKITFATTFDVKSMPCIVLYDKNNNLIEKIKGQTKAETLIKKLGITN
jgi:peroxiredoxin